MRKHPLSMLPPGMEGKQNNGLSGKDKPMDEWQRNAAETISRTRPTQSTIRAVTPDDDDEDTDDSLHTRSKNIDIPSLQTSPRSILGGVKSSDRRQGLVFGDSFDAEDSSSMQELPPPQMQQGSFTLPSQPVTRPRTRTLEEPRRRAPLPTSISKSRHRIGSVHSTGSAGLLDDDRPDNGTSSSGHPLPTPGRQHSHLRKSPSTKEKNGWRLARKTSPRPSSPVTSPTVDSLPVPVETADANKILKLMRNLAGRMRGTVEYQTSVHGAWASGICYIDEAKGALMYEGEDRGPFHQTLIPDLRGCRVRPILSLEKSGKCLEITASSTSKVQLLPLVSTEFDHWLSALLCWEQLRPGTSRIDLPDSENHKPAALSRTSSFNPLKDANIIKVGKLLLWDKGALLSPTSILRRSTARDNRPVHRLWRRVSCILQDNGEFKLLTENDVTLLSVIQLSQLSRCAIQQLDRSVLNEEYCIAIFPQYTSTSTSISIIRPVFIALESRVLFEVWFVLLRAFAIPEIYGPTFSSGHSEDGSQGSDSYPNSSDMFRIEKSLHIRLIEAKIRKASVKQEVATPSKHSVKPEPDLAVGDYFAEIILDGEVRSRTMTKKETKNPFWREDCEFLDLPATLPELSVVVKKLESASAVPALTTRSSTSIHSPDHIIETICGTVHIRLDELNRGKDVENWQPILSDKQETIGEIFLKIRHDETVVLMAKDYQVISEMLHKFTSGLTIQLAQTVPSKLKYLSEKLMNIFQVSGQATQWLMALVEDEIDGIGKEIPHTRLRFSRRVGSNDSFESASEREITVRDMGKSLTGEANLLFRGNSLLTQALDFHMRRLGKEYLEEVLLDKISEINTINPDCEVDPSRLSHGDDITKNWSQLITLTTGVWNAIAASAHRCPAELRQILKFIRAVADDRYGDFLRTVPYTSVSGFLFLRFFCPAILNPKLFGLLRDHPRPKAQRTLTLIAKSLQVLANLSTFGQKEAWMEPMNRFLSSHRQSVKTFIDDVCALPAQSSSFAVPASYSTPITILGRLPPTSREGFPSLPYLIDHARNFAALVKLWLESTQHLHPPQALDGDLLNFHQECISLQQKTDECVRKAEQADKYGDDNDRSIHWDDIVNSLETSSLTPLNLPSGMIDPESTVPVTRFSNSLSSAAAISPHHSTTTSNGRQVSSTFRNSSRDRENLPPSSAGSETGSKERRDRQSFWESTFGKDSKYQRPYEPADDSLNPATASPPNRNGGKSKPGFLSGLRKKEKSEKVEKEKKSDKGDTRTIGAVGKMDAKGEKEKKDRNEKVEKPDKGDTWAMGALAKRDAKSKDGKREKDGDGDQRPGSSWNDGMI